MHLWTRRITMLVLIAALGAACGGPEERKANYRSKAQEYMDQRNFPKARVALRNVLKIDPKDPDAYYLAAVVDEKEKNWRGAVANLQQVIELAPDHREASIKLAKYYLEAKAGERVLELAHRVQRTHPQDPQAAALVIAVTAISGQIAEATAQAEALFKIHGTEPDVGVLLSTLYAHASRYPDAIAILETTLKHHSKHLELMGVLAATQEQAGDVRGAERTYQSIIQVEPSNFDHRVKLASFFDQHGKYDRAEQVLHEAVQLDGNQEMRWLALASYVASRQGLAQGERVLVEARSKLPHAEKLPFALAGLFEQFNQYQKAQALYEELLDAHKGKPAAVEARVRLVALEFQQGHQAEAQQRLEAILHDYPRSADALTLQGKMALNRKDGTGAVQAFRTVLKDQPERADIHLLLGQAYLSSGEVSLARESFEKAVGLNPRLLEGRRVLAGLMAGAGKTKEARDRLEGILKDEPRDLASLGMLLHLQVAEQDWSKTEDTLAQLRDSGQERYLVLMTEGNLLLARRHFDKATMAFEQALAANPAGLDALLALVRLDTRQGKLPQAKQRLDTLLAAQPEHRYAYGLLGEVLLLQGDRRGAEEAFRVATERSPQWVVPWINWATVKLADKQPAESEKILTNALRQSPVSEELHMLMASVLTQQGAFDRAIREYETVLQRNPQAVLAANNLASLLTDHRGDPRSLERALALSHPFEKSAANPFFLDTLGWVHHKMGHYDDALRIMRQAVSKAPEHPIINYHIGVTYFDKGDRKEARAHLERSLRTGLIFDGHADAKKRLGQLNS